MDADGLHDLFAPMGAVRVKRMFGGYGVYADDLIFALQVDGEVLLKGDAQTAEAFAQAGCAQWTYASKTGRAAAMPYWRMPDACFDEPEELARWAGLALEASRRADKAKRDKASAPPARRAGTRRRAGS